MLMPLRWLVVEDEHSIAVATEHVTILQCQLVGFHYEVVASEGCRLHKQRRQWMVEVGNHRIGQTEVVGRENELVGPSLILLHLYPQHRCDVPVPLSY